MNEDLTVTLTVRDMLTATRAEGDCKVTATVTGQDCEQGR